MAQGPDPNRWTPTDPDTTRGRMGDPPSTRLGLSSGGIVVLVLVILVVAMAVFWYAE